MIFKIKFQELIYQKFLSCSKKQSNVKKNPLPGHNGPIINAIDEEGHTKVVKEVIEVKTPMFIVMKILREQGFLKDLHDDYGVCKLEPDQYGELKICLQCLMGQGMIQFTEAEINGEVSTIERITIVYKLK